MARPRELLLALAAGGCAAGIVLLGAGSSSAATTGASMSVLDILIEDEAVESADAAGGTVAFASIGDLDPGLVSFGDDARTPGQVVSDRVANDELLAALAKEESAKRKALATTPLIAPGSAATGTAGIAPIPTTAKTAKSAEIQRLIKRYFPQSQLGNAMAVAACESGHSDAIGAVNNDGTRDWGAFQLNDGGTLQGALHAIGEDFSSTEEAQKLALNTEINVRAAARIYEARRWAPWVCAYKIGVVGSLYGNDPGPMNNKFDEWGKPTVPVPQIPVSAPDPEPSKSPKATREPKPTATKKPPPSGTASPSPSATPGESASASPSTTATPPPPSSSTPQSSAPPATVAPSPSASATASGTGAVDRSGDR